MPEPLAKDQAAAIARGGTGLKAQLRRMIDRLLSRHQLAKRVFCGDDGELTRASVEWMRRIARENYVEGGGFDRDPYQNAFNDGRRALALEILSATRIDAERLGALTKLERDSQ